MMKFLPTNVPPSTRPPPSPPPPPARNYHDTRIAAADLVALAPTFNEARRAEARLADDHWESGQIQHLAEERDRHDAAFLEGYRMGRLAHEREELERKRRAAGRGA